MNKIEYKVDKYSAENFRQIVAFCDEKGECSMDSLPAPQIEKLTEILNAQGNAGWDLVQLLFGQGGALAVWKRTLA